MHNPTDRITLTTAFVTPVVEHLVGMRNCTMSKRSNHGATSHSQNTKHDSVLYAGNFIQEINKISSHEYNIK